MPPCIVFHCPKTLKQKGLLVQGVFESGHQRFDSSRETGVVELPEAIYTIDSGTLTSWHRQYTIQLRILQFELN